MATKHIDSIRKSLARRPGLMAAVARKVALRVILVFALAALIATGMIFAGFWIPGAAWQRSF
jgi:hypothetical protein